MNKHDDGRLFLVSTPIGNLEDITLRALNVLREADLIAAEDTRHTRRLLTHFDIHSRLTSFHAFNEHGKCDALLDEVAAGARVALVSDAGTPGIADPGFLLVREARKRNVPVTVVPGVSALTFAAVASGLPIDRLAFYGFPPVKSGRRRKFFERVAAEDKTVFLYESPFRISSALAEIVACGGERRLIALVREATKLHEEVIYGPAGEIQARTAERNWKGEFVIGVAAIDAGDEDSVEYLGETDGK
ncbi:16S rRNA (cytidine(1402)-2'-O)-methyltransferase [Victivallis sp. Marseille-Q1083]|uniref:16S rRNA (cytidine(1402)-2'-O)-methyltransferase n=1 Tax=Victivallis sp. Marseille-Q1083 TaxID=2717288 RepID=UPI00158C86C2|nr:16S rRNA (cytidine(1402)-2'-O)-methyltransferase [Victivallis sp. Marseille-Q1083]